MSLEGVPAPHGFARTLLRSDREKGLDAALAVTPAEVARVLIAHAQETLAGARVGLDDAQRGLAAARARFGPYLKPAGRKAVARGG